MSEHTPDCPMGNDGKDYIQVIAAKYVDVAVHRERACLILTFHSFFGPLSFVLDKESALNLSRHVIAYLDPEAAPPSEMTPLELTIKELLGSDDDAHE